jgi:uncharacterized membrane protein YhiD involved in acid resistance
MDMASFVLNNGLALILGALIGFERQWRNVMPAYEPTRW